jgi:hypothetical protein
MARYEFRFIVTDVELSEEHQRKVSQSIAEAGSLAVAAQTPRGALTVVGESPALHGPDWPWIWCGLPPVTIGAELQAFAFDKVNETGETGER